MVPEAAKDPLLPQPPLQGPWGLSRAAFRVGNSSGGVLLKPRSTPLLSCVYIFYYFAEGPETGSVILEVPALSPFYRPITMVTTVTASSPRLHTNCRGSVAQPTASAVGPSEGMCHVLSSPGPWASPAGGKGLNTFSLPPACVSRP